LSNNDPTDHALAAIASILDQPQVRPEQVRPEPEIHHEPEIPSEPEIGPEPIPEFLAVAVEEKPLAPEILEAAGYSKVGPGPIAAIRFKWTVRQEANGEYYVDETIGENSAPIIAGPMSRDAAVRLVDDRESETQRRFELLRSEMTGRAAAASLARNDGGEM
jgi:hypothetical protein